jgi:hypothetical protein
MHARPAGTLTAVTITFCPRDGKVYDASIPVFLNEDTKVGGCRKVASDGQLPLFGGHPCPACTCHAQPYISIEVLGQGQHPRLTFDVREATLPPVCVGCRLTGICRLQ